MFRRAVVCLGIVACLTCLIGAQEEETVLGKKRSEWLKLLKGSKEAKFRRASLIALEVIGPKAGGVVDGILEGDLGGWPGGVHLGADLSEGDVSRPAQLRLLVKKDKADIVREASARSLGKLADQAESQVLILAGALADKHAGTRAAAAETLNELGDKARPALPHLLKVLGDKNADRFTRTYAALILVRFDDEFRTIIPALGAVLADKDAPLSVREAAADAMGRLGGGTGAHAAEGLAKILASKTEKAELRRAAAIALGKVGAKVDSSWPAAKIALQDADNSLRYQAIRLAGRLAKEVMNERAAVSALADVAAKDDNTENRLAAIQELGQLGAAAADAVQTLTRLASGDSRASIREAAEDALKKIKAGP